MTDEHRPRSSSDRSEAHRRRRGKNWALFLALVALIVLFYAITIVRMGRLL